MVANLLNLTKLFFFIQKSNLKKAFLNKGDATVNVLMMLINNLSFVFMWWVIFEDRGSINGWNFGDMALLFCVLNNAYAFFALCTFGVRNLPEYIESGNLDNFLATPKHPLFMISTSEAVFANWGDFITGFIMFFLSGYVSLSSFFIMLAVSFGAFLIVFSYRLIVSSLCFFVPGTQKLGDNIFMAFLTFGSQPASIFTSWYKVMFLTIIPSGFISLYPVELIKNFNFSDLTIFISGIIIFLALSLIIFNLGLRRYTSGNRFGIR